MLKPSNLLLAIGTEGAGQVIEEVLKDAISFNQTMVRLSNFFKIRVWFKNPVSIQVPQTRIKISDNQWILRTAIQTGCHVFTRFFEHNSQLCYKTKRNSRRGYFFPTEENIVKYELVIPKESQTTRTAQFQTFDAFKKRFDPYFISINQIGCLWQGHSSQHGGVYVPNDFRAIGPAGKQVMKRFLDNFKGITNGGGPGYKKSIHGDYTVLTEKHYSYRHPGKDITIEHNSNLDYVFYSSEKHGCGNGRYGLIVNRNTYLWLEDD